jgi:hypothetical protein
MVVTTLEPPANDPPVTADGQHTQSWTAFYQDVATNLGAMQPKQGVTDGSDAAAGNLGEYLFASGSGVGLGNGTPTNVATLALTAGDWDVSGNVQFVATGVLTRVTAGVSTVSGDYNRWSTTVSGTLGSGSSQQIGTGGAVRVSVAAPTTAYLVAATTFTSGGVTADGTIWARRAR